LYLKKLNKKIIYGITDVIVCSSSQETSTFKPNSYVEQNWGEYIWINIKLSSGCNHFDLFFSFMDCNIFWGLSFNKNNVRIFTRDSVSDFFPAGKYIRLLYNAKSEKFVALGCSDLFEEITLRDCNIFCGVVRSWFFSSSSIIKVFNKENVQRSIEIKGFIAIT
jgi:hypothetical protein